MNKIKVTTGNSKFAIFSVIGRFLFIALATLGLLDMAAQAMTEGKVKIIHAMLECVFG